MMLILAAVSLNAVVATAVYVVGAALIFWLLWWLLDYISLPQPFDKILRVILAILAVIFLINLILSLMGRPAIII